ncbi:ATP-binding protein [Amycolatopsis sp. NPDC059657]|uniref:ATP-binding protein n=1 Tax=Amycolatopsis sp. NPDC059657 TaxID=3346899 RepID=UPI00366FD8A1
MTGEDPLSCELSTLHGATIVRTSGVLNVHTYPRLRDILLKCAADQPRAVIADLDELKITHDYLTSVFVTVWMRISTWSAVPLIVVPGPATAALFDHQPARRFLTTQPTVLAALEHLHEPPSRQRTELWLPPSPLSVHAARQFVTDTCHNWDIGAMTADAVTVASELVANAARHTHSPARLRLELRSRTLTVAVADDDPRPAPLPQPPDTPGDRRGGLRLITQLAYICGCSHRQSGGKVTWAVLRMSR